MLENRLAEILSLDGNWLMTIADQSGTVRVPGAWEVQGYPDVEGPAIYQRIVDIPAAWLGTRVMLRFGAVSYYAEAAINDVFVGRHEGLWTSFEFDVTAALRFGATNMIQVTITKPADDGDRFPYGDVLVGFIPYISTTFGGMWQHVELIAHRAPAFAHLHVTADAETGQVDISADLAGDATGLSARAEVLDTTGLVVAVQPIDEIAYQIDAVLKIDKPRMWSPADPAHYDVRLTLWQDETCVSEAHRRIGFRALYTEDERLLLNGAPISLRGVLSWGWNPNTLAPIFSDEEIRAEFVRVRALGFNLYKLCLYVPSERIFEIADEEGMLLWLELPMWLPRLSDHLRQQAQAEYADILARVHHHPSVVIYSLGCELSADMADADLLAALDGITRGATHGAMVCDNSGSGEAFGGLTSDLADFNDYHFYCDLQYFAPLCDHFRRDWRPARPWIFGEFCDCDDYRDPAVDAGMRPWWRDLLGKDGSIHRWAYRDQEALVGAHELPFTDAQIQEHSRQHALVVRKRILENVRSRADIRGYVVTGLRDTPMFSGGLFDAAGQPKFDADSFRQFNADAVLLLEQGRHRLWRHGGDRPARQDKFNYEAGTTASFRVVLASVSTVLREGTLTWTLMSADQAVTYTEGTLALAPYPALPPVHELALLDVLLPTLDAPASCILTLALSAGDFNLHNEWTLWVYPLDSLDERLAALVTNGGSLEIDGVRISNAFTPELEVFVRAGGSLLVLQTGEGALPTKALPFWRESLKLLYDHPALAGFPHAGFPDLQFYSLATDYAFDTDALAAHFGANALHPIMRRLDARLFTLSEYLVELQFGTGRMFATTLRFGGGAGDQVQGLSANVAGRWLLARLIAALHESVAETRASTP